MKFKVKQTDLDKIAASIIADLGPKVRDEMRDEYDGLKTYYPKSGRSKKIVYDSNAKVVGADDYGIAASDSGGEWKWPGKLPNLDKIKEWVRNDFDGGRHASSSDSVVARIAYNIAKKIKDNGLNDDGNYWTDETLLNYVQQYGANGSGRI